MVDVEKREVVAVDVREPQLGVVGSLLGLVRPHEALRHRQHRGDRQDLVGAVVLARRDQHFGQLRVERKLGHNGTQLGQVAVVVQRSKVIEKPVKKNDYYKLT